MKKTIIGTIAVTVGVVLGFVFQPLISSDNLYNQFRKYEYVFSTAFKNYVDDVESEKLTEAAIQGMLEQLDPHSVYISAEQMKRVREDFQGSFDGIGVEFDIINDTITVISPIPGGPSEELGILSGDKIVKIDNEDVVGIDRMEVPKKLKGPKGTIVQVDIKRNGMQELLHFDIERDKIPLYSVDASFKVDETDIGVIRVNRFSATTHDELMQAVKELKSEGMKKLILDLRGNPGGYLNQAFLMADEFLPGGDTIVYTQGRKAQFDEVFPSSNAGSLLDIPLIVLIDAGSASASEIVSGSVQDLDRGLIVGETSFGKGLVQRQFDIGDGSAFRLTISRYYTPSGRSIQRPYEDKDAYRRLVGRLELDEGANMEHKLETIKKSGAKTDEEKEEIASLDSLIYYSKSGRPLFGGGGITPDYIVKQDTITRFSALLRSKRLMYEFATQLVNSPEFKQKFAGDYTNFLRQYMVDDAKLADFRKYAESKDVEWKEDEYKIDKDFLQNEIKANMARINWDREKYVEVFMSSDKQLQKAISLFPEAQKIANLSKK